MPQQVHLLLLGLLLLKVPTTSTPGSGSEVGNILSDIGGAAMRALSSKESAISTLYGDVETLLPQLVRATVPKQNRNSSSENLPNGPDASPVSGLAEGEEGGAGLAADLGEAGSLALLASKRFIKSVLDPVDDNLKFAKYHYIRKEGDQYCIWQKKTGKTLSCHDSKEKAEAAFRGMMMSKHGG